jgi:hypothetical protein
MSTPLTSSKLITHSHQCRPTPNTQLRIQPQGQMLRHRQDQGRITCIQMSTTKESRWWPLWQPIVKAYTLKMHSNLRGKDTLHPLHLVQVFHLIYPLSTPISSIMMMCPALQWWVTHSLREAQQMTDRLTCNNSIFHNINLSMMTLKIIPLGVTSSTSLWTYTTKWKIWSPNTLTWPISTSKSWWNPTKKSPPQPSLPVLNHKKKIKKGAMVSPTGATAATHPPTIISSSRLRHRVRAGSWRINSCLLVRDR